MPVAQPVEPAHIFGPAGIRIPREPNRWPPPPRLTHRPDSSQKSLTVVPGSDPADYREVAFFNRSFPLACGKLAARNCEYTVHKPWAPQNVGDVTFFQESKSKSS